MKPRDKTNGPTRIEKSIKTTVDMTDHILDLMEKVHNKEISLQEARFSLNSMRQLTEIKKVEIMATRVGKTSFDAVNLKPQRSEPPIINGEVVRNDSSDKTRPIK